MAHDHKDLNKRMQAAVPEATYQRMRKMAYELDSTVSEIGRIIILRGMALLDIDQIIAKALNEKGAGK